ncbi:MAG: host attachment protein [Myxococcales bacterium]|nr:host attachment protein [Myxococcales bacterium]
MHVMIVADAARARFFTADAELEQLEEVAHLEHPEGRLHGREIYTDGHGRRSGASLDPHTERKQSTDDAFARRVATEATRWQEQGERWIVVAPPAFLGRLRTHLSPQIAGRVVASVHKDLTHVPVHDLGHAVRRALPPLAGLGFHP